MWATSFTIPVYNFLSHGSVHSILYQVSTDSSYVYKATPVRTLQLTSLLLQILYLVNTGVRYSAYTCGDKS